MTESAKPCENGHTWSNQFGDDWTPDYGVACDCGLKKWGVRTMRKLHCDRCDEIVSAGAYVHLRLEDWNLGKPSEDPDKTTHVDICMPCASSLDRFLKQPPPRPGR